jgi:16S rRNA (cytosine967-C5)-methyltransferase
MTDLLRCALPLDLDPELAALARRPFLADHVCQALTEARRQPSHATPNLARWLRKTRRLGSRDRRTVSELVHGVIRHEAILLTAGARSDVELVQRYADVLDGDRFSTLPGTSPVEEYATALNVPGPVASAWLDALGADEAAAYAQAINARPPLTIRCNRLKGDRLTLAGLLKDAGVDTTEAPTPDGLIVTGRANLQGLDAFKRGWFEVQDVSSQRLCEAIPLHREDWVLDLCAGAGGKSLALAARGVNVHAFDIRDDALKQLQRRAVRAGASIVIDSPAPAPVVLVDAPCSGSGRLRRNPALRWGLDAAAHLQTQAEVLAAGAQMVQPGGLLVYATCSVLPAENAHQPPGAGWNERETQTLWPHRDGTDGFFWRMWERTGL